MIADMTHTVWLMKNELKFEDNLGWQYNLDGFSNRFWHDGALGQSDFSLISQSERFLSVLKLVHYLSNIFSKIIKNNIFNDFWKYWKLCRRLVTEKFQKNLFQNILNWWNQWRISFVELTKKNEISKFKKITI